MTSPFGKCILEEKEGTCTKKTEDQLEIKETYSVIQKDGGCCVREVGSQGEGAEQAVLHHIYSFFHLLTIHRYLFFSIDLSINYG